MPSQDNTTSIPFLHAPDGAGYRLLELPPDLVAEASSPWFLHTDGTGMARLRTAQGRTYALRQKNTSNALMLLSVRADAGGAAAETAAEAVGPKPSLAIAATLHETVELIEVPAEEEVSASASASASSAATEAAAAPAPKAIPSRGKWHEKFAKTR